ncbi:glycosyltransferase family 2 protein [Paenibacillus sp. J5C_2022]|uniref:glycosyltransferase family 2 protein n=1 Tax=Paenibacillus sp. J5C2022 TaxID=2977129 RepID=UPI0021CE019B|nr:glycosyltransferase family 2 protein [Paenibacillus sp. J5C2022]MCU6710653.1 glycosyltransferase family 2 protein [Paenibacillus sp. J5C2022]
MIVRDEEQTLERCLSSVAHIVDEIVIVDTGSNDRTKEIAGKFTGNVLDFQWIDDFAAARNYAFGQATQQYILWLDADDVVSAEDGEKLLALKNSMAWYTDAVSMNYQLAFDQSGRAVSSLRRNRLVKRSNGYRWVGAVHEYLEVFGRIQHSDIGVAHQRMHKQSSRNLSIYDNMVRDGKPFSARDLYYYANELMDHSLWERALGRYDEFLERGEGWIEDRLQACGKASECLCQLGRVQEAKEKALKAFTLAIPRAEICCRLGYYELEAGQYEHAVYWYKLALSLDKPLDPMAMLNESCWTWLPHLQLCVCYHKLGRNGLAANHNEAAAGYVPEHEAVRRNQQYFQQLNA